MKAIHEIVDLFVDEVHALVIMLLGKQFYAGVGFRVQRLLQPTSLFEKFGVNPLKKLSPSCGKCLKEGPSTQTLQDTKSLFWLMDRDQEVQVLFVIIRMLSSKVCTNLFCSAQIGDLIFQRLQCFDIGFRSRFRLPFLSCNFGNGCKSFCVRSAARRQLPPNCERSPVVFLSSYEIILSEIKGAKIMKGLCGKKSGVTKLFVNCQCTAKIVLGLGKVAAVSQTITYIRQIHRDF